MLVRARVCVFGLIIDWTLIEWLSLSDRYEWIYRADDYEGYLCYLDNYGVARAKPIHPIDYWGNNKLTAFVTFSL